MNKKICLIHIMSRLGQDLFLKEVKFSTLKNTLSRSYRRKKDYYFVFSLWSSTKYQKSLRNRSSPLFRLFRLCLKSITVQPSSCHEELTTAPSPLNFRDFFYYLFRYLKCICRSLYLENFWLPICVIKFNLVKCKRPI